MKNMFRYAVLAGILMASASVYADIAASTDTSPSFNYVEVLAQAQDLPVTNGYGVQIDFSKTLGDVLFVTGEADRANLDIAGADTFRLGLGLRTGEIVPGAVAYGEAYLLHANINFNDFTNLKTVDSYGYGFEGGIRYNLNPALEVRGGAATERLTETSAWTTYGLVGAQLNLTENVSIVADAKIHSSTDRIYQAGVRFSF